MRIPLSFIITISLAVAAGAFAQATSVTYTEEFAGGTLQSGNIGENGWSVQGTPGFTIMRGPAVFPDRPLKSGPVGMITVTAPAGQAGSFPSWAALALGNVSPHDAQEALQVSIPTIQTLDVWQSEFTFTRVADTSGNQVMRVGLFLPFNGEPPNAGCYVEYGGRGIGADPFGGAFQYVFFDGALYLTEVSSGVLPDPDFGAFYTFRIRRNSGESFTMTLTKAGSTSENLDSARTLNPRQTLSTRELVPAFYVSQGFTNDAAMLTADYFFFKHDRIRR